MSTAAAAVILVARLLLLGSEGTETLSEHRARIPEGGTGLIRETLRIQGLPGGMNLYLSPQPQASPAGTDPEPPPLTVQLRAELWSDQDGARSGRPPDEVNIEEIPFNIGGKALVQVAEDPGTGNRLMLSLAEVQKEPAGPALPPPPEAVAPNPVWVRTEVYREQGGVRELVARNILRTLENREVSKEVGISRPIPGSPGEPPRLAQEWIRITVKPGTLSQGWMTVHARIEARALPSGEDGDEAMELSAESTRTTPPGVPFVLEMPLPRWPEGDDPESEEERNNPEEAIVVEITPFMPSAEGR